MRLREFASVPYRRLGAKAGPRDVCVVPLDGDRVVPNEDLTIEDRAALGWASRPNARSAPPSLSGCGVVGAASQLASSR